MKKHINKMMIQIKQIPRRAFQVEESLHMRHKQAQLIRLIVKEHCGYNTERERERSERWPRAELYRALEITARTLAFALRVMKL